MSARKQQLLQQHRRRKRLILLVALSLLLVISLCGYWWAVPLLVLLGWIAHEAWFADHLFYSPRDDYQYAFPPETARFAVRLNGAHLQLDGDLPEDLDTLLLEIRVQATGLGRFLDPQVLIQGVHGDRQDFERGVQGRRYLNLSGQAQALREGRLGLRGRHCRLAGEGVLYGFVHLDYSQQSLLIIAPHADDAELAAFGLYSRSPAVHIVTLTQGEIEAEHYQKLGLDKAAAARLKGRLRTWDSLGTPLWGGVPSQRCLQLGYYCLQLAAMAEQPNQPFASRESGESDIRSARRSNALSLPGDQDGAPTWTNLVADLAALIERIQPQVIVTAHPELDPHSDHVQGTRALLQALQSCRHQVQSLLLYANHLHDNDRWPMGPAQAGIALPPCIEALPADALWSPWLSLEQRIDKAQALALQHDLRTPLSLKQRLRRKIQWLLAGRRWPVTGENEFFRKAVRCHELFWVRRLP